MDYFSIILGMSSSQLTLTPSFFRGVGLNHQPAIVCLVNQINRTILMTASPVDWNTSQGKGRLLSNWSMDSIATQSGRAWNILPINTETTWSTGLLSRSRSGDAACVVFRKIYSTLQTCRTCEDAKETRRRKVYPLVICHITMERSTIFHGKIHYKWWFSIARLNYQRVYLNQWRFPSKWSTFLKCFENGQKIGIPWLKSTNQLRVQPPRDWTRQE